jgi:hypothetical protein
LLSIVFRPESLAGFSSLRLDFARRQRSRRPRRIAPITIFSPLWSPFGFVSEYGGGRDKSFQPTVLFNSGDTQKVSRAWRDRAVFRGLYSPYKRGRMAETNTTSRDAVVRPARPRLLVLFERLVRWPQPSQILLIERAERCRHCWSNPDDAFFQISPKQCDIQIAAKKQLGAAHCGRAAGVTRAVVVHFVHHRVCIMDNVPPTGRVTVFVHLISTTRAYGILDVISFAVAQSLIPVGKVTLENVLLPTAATRSDFHL